MHFQKILKRLLQGLDKLNIIGILNFSRRPSETGISVTGHWSDDLIRFDGIIL